MWRAFFLALGIYSCLLGAQCLAVDSVVLNRREPAADEGAMAFITSRVRPAQNQEVTPPDAAPWTLLSIGAVTILYSFTIPKRAGK